MNVYSDFSLTYWTPPTPGTGAAVTDSNWRLSRVWQSAFSVGPLVTHSVRCAWRRKQRSKDSEGLIRLEMRKPCHEKKPVGFPKAATRSGLSVAFFFLLLPPLALANIPHVTLPETWFTAPWDWGIWANELFLQSWLENNSQFFRPFDLLKWFKYFVNINYLQNY